MIDIDGAILAIQFNHWKSLARLDAHILERASFHKLWPERDIRTNGKDSSAGLVYIKKGHAADACGHKIKGKIHF
jgi:hypothetical protein